MYKQKGIIHLALPLFLLLILGAVIFVLISLKIIKLPSKIVPGVSKQPTVALQTQYQNPFDGKFVNPFAGYKNPFDAIK